MDNKILRNSIKAVLWDMDGVLIDSEPGYNQTIGEMLNSLGYEYGEEEIMKTTGASYKDVAGALGLKEPAEEIERLYIEALLRSLRVNVTELIPGVSEFLDWLQQRNIKMALGTSSPLVSVELVIEKFSLHKWISVMVTGSDVDKGKPAPDIYLRCAELLSAAPEECLVVEDSANGIKAGKNAGMWVCAFTGAQHHAFDLSQADFELKSFGPEDLPKIKELFR